MVTVPAHKTKVQTRKGVATASSKVLENLKLSVEDLGVVNGR